MKRLDALFGLCLWVAACGPAQSPPGAVSPELAPAVEAARPGARYVPLSAPTDPALLSAPARVSADPASRGQVTAVAHGQIVKTLVRVGERVEAGQPLVQLRAPELLQAATGAHSLQAQLSAHRERLASLEALAAEGLAKRETTFALRARVADLQAQASAARATLKGAGLNAAAAERMRRRGYLLLRAPIAGVVASLNATPGAAYEPYGQGPLAEILGEGPAWIAADMTRLPPADLAVRFEAVDGRTFALDPEPVSRLTRPSGGLRLFYRLAEDTAKASGADGLVDGLVDGLAGRVRFAPRGGDSYQVQVGALRQDAQGSHLQVLRDGEHVRVPVAVQGKSGTAALVRGALSPGDRALIESRPDTTAETTP